MGNLNAPLGEGRMSETLRLLKLAKLFEKEAVMEVDDSFTSKAIDLDDLKDYVRDEIEAYEDRISGLGEAPTVFLRTRRGTHGVPSGDGLSAPA
jgi:hypothetical protein